MPTKQQLDIDADTAEALARRAEAEALCFRRQAVSHPIDPEAFSNLMEQRGSESADFARRAAEMRPTGAQDPEGTPYPLADRRGNFAENADQANMGGIGVFDSNSREVGLEEGTPNVRLYPEIARGEEFAPSVDQVDLNEFMPEGGEYDQEEQDEVDREQARKNLEGDTGMVAPTGSTAEEGDVEGTSGRRRGRPRKGK